MLGLPAPYRIPGQMCLIVILFKKYIRYYYKLLIYKAL